MDNEAKFIPEEAVAVPELFAQHGEIQLSAEEMAYLDEARLGQFEKHPVLNGVEIRGLDIGLVPEGIKKILAILGADITSFSAVRMQKEVPLHKHIADGEIYFGGANGVITLLDASRNEIGQFALADNSFAVTPIGEWHGVASGSEAGSTFFGVKFVVKKNQ